MFFNYDDAGFSQNLKTFFTDIVSIEWQEFIAAPHELMKYTEMQIYA